MPATNYPTKKVILSYSLLGGAVGGLLLGIIFFLKSLAGIFLLVIPLAILYGIGIGFIPAIVCGILLASNQVVVKSKKDYLPVSLLGFITTFIYYCFIALFANRLEFLELIIYCSQMSIIGALSALIVGKLVLPKEKIHASN